MQVLAIVVLVACCCAATAKQQRVEKEKRGASFTTPRAYSAGTSAAAAAADAAYAGAKVTPQTFASGGKEYVQPQYQVKYVQAQQDAAPQYQYEYEQQPYAAATAAAQPQRQQQVTKLAPAKTAYAPTPVHFSLASDVSSFSYSSPLVSYSNLGLLKQTLGKSVEQPTAEQSYAQPQVAQRAHNQYASDSKVAYAPQQYVTYKQSQKVVLQAAPTAQKLAYNAPAHAQKVSYAQPAQRVVYAQLAPAPAPASGQQAYKAGAAIVYASSAEEAYEKIYGKPYVAPQQQLYDAQPVQPQHQGQVQQTQAQSTGYHGQQQQQVQYVKLTPQQYAAYAQQLQQQQQQQQHQQQAQYVDAQAPQYSGSHSELQPTYAARPQFYQKYATE